MAGYGQYCPIARASEILGERWTTIIVRNLLLGCHTFNEIAEGAPGINRSLLSERLKKLERYGVISRQPNSRGRGSLYRLTQAGHELDQVCDALGTWGMRWLEVRRDHTDPRVVLWGLCKGLARVELPDRRMVVRFDLRDQPRDSRAFWLLVQRPEPEVCYHHPGYEEDVVVTTETPVLAAWHMGRISLEEGVRRGAVRVEGPPRLRRLLSSWGGLDPFSRVMSARATEVPVSGPISVLEGGTTQEDGGIGSASRGIGMDSSITTSIDVGSVDEFRSRLRGSVLRPGDVGYEEARRIWNGDIDRRPALIARCAGTSDVVAAVRFARARNLVVAVRGGGHAYAGHSVCEGGLLIDLSAMKGIRVEPERRAARAEGGVLWGELDRETQCFGLATTGGVVSHTGIAGLTLGGGIGHLMRSHGMTVDNLLSVDLVTADGEFLTVDEGTEPDLFWGLRGGGGNFGIATSFRYRLHSVGPTVLGGLLLYPSRQAPEVLASVRELVDEGPDDVGGLVSLRLAPPLPGIPEKLHFQPVVAVLVCYAGDPEEGSRVLEGFRRRGTPVDLVRPVPYTAVQTLLDRSFPHGQAYYTRGLRIRELSEDAIDVLLSALESIPSARSSTALFMLGGAMSRVGAEETAVANRDAGFEVNLTASWTPGDDRERHLAWVRRVHDALLPHASGVYTNFLSDDGASGVERAYGDHIARLVELKRRYDPDNFFRLNHNISPDRGREVGPGAQR
jgi:FAD/FMN-containing dehydrogenase/DNA-binding HxlR family transcriptional regulator